MIHLYTCIVFFNYNQLYIYIDLLTVRIVGCWFCWMVGCITSPRRETSFCASPKSCGSSSKASALGLGATCKSRARHLTRAEMS